MPSITALLHTRNDVLRLGRCLETLYPCDDILIVDQGSHDGTLEVAREYGARVVAARAGARPVEYIRSVGPGWFLCLDPHESLTESLAASLFEWKSEPLPESPSAAPAFSVFLREETVAGWVENPRAQTRLVSSDWKIWDGMLPASDPSALALEGEVLRFVFP